MSITKLQPKPQDLEKWGTYAKATRLFVEKVKSLPGVRAVAAKYCGDYVDLWVFTDEAHQSELIPPVGAALKQLGEQFPELLFDSFVTRQEIPDGFVVFFHANAPGA
jgi:hypothetical protein